MLDAFNIQFECRPKRFEAVLCLQHCCIHFFCCCPFLFGRPLFSSSLSCSLIYLTASTTAFPLPLFHHRTVPAALFRRLDSESNKMHDKQFPRRARRAGNALREETAGGDNGRLVSSSYCCFSELFSPFFWAPIDGLTVAIGLLELTL